MILNAGNQTAHGCAIAAETPVDADFSFQTTDPATNQLTGQRNRSVSIPAGGSQTFLVAFDPRAAASAEAWLMRLRFSCTGLSAAQSFESVNTVLLSMSPNAVPDIVPIAVTVSNDQVVRLAGNSATGVMAAAAVNIGRSATLAVRPRVTGGAAATTTICRTLASGECAHAPAASVSHAFPPNATFTFTVFVTANGSIPYDPAGKRVMLDFVDANGVVRGQTAAAITTTQ